MNCFRMPVGQLLVDSQGHQVYQGPCCESASRAIHPIHARQGGKGSSFMFCGGLSAPLACQPTPSHASDMPRHPATCIVSAMRWRNSSSLAMLRYPRHWCSISVTPRMPSMASNHWLATTAITTALAIVHLRRLVRRFGHRRVAPRQAVNRG